MCKFVPKLTGAQFCDVTEEWDTEYREDKPFSDVSACGTNLDFGPTLSCNTHYRKRKIKKKTNKINFIYFVVSVQRQEIISSEIYISFWANINKQHWNPVVYHETHFVATKGFQV